jgi:AraC family transcriptional regulator of adaptative response/methylated-DNA-[protein]-cysteine methyltransferase
MRGYEIVSAGATRSWRGAFPPPPLAASENGQHPGAERGRLRAGGKVMESRSIVYGIQGCSLGRLLVAATERGVCRIALGDGDEELEFLLRSEFPCAPLVRDEVAVKPWSEAVAAYAAGHARRLELPLDVAGSRFQQRVWAALRRIPRGETRTYGEIARQVGVEKGARAVARACAANPVAIAVPCHRVVPADGTLGGYRFGPARKRALLRIEGQAPPSISEAPPAPERRAQRGGAERSS